MEASRSKSKDRHRRRRKTAESEGQVASTLYKVPANGGISERSGVTVAHRRYLSPTRASRRGVRVPRAHARTKGVLRALTCPLRVEVPWDLRTRESLDTVSAMESGGSLTAQSAFIVSRLGQEWPANRGPRWGRGRCNGHVSLQKWRRGWDSNPRTSHPVGGFQDRCLRPLGHPSGRASVPTARRWPHGGWVWDTRVHGHADHRLLGRPRRGTPERTARRVGAARTPTG